MKNQLRYNSIGRKGLLWKLELLGKSPELHIGWGWKTWGRPDAPYPTRVSSASIGGGSRLVVVASQSVAVLLSQSLCCSVSQALK